MTIRLVIADDQHLVRAGFSAMLSHGDEFEVVAQCADGVEAVEAVQSLRPDVALLDIRMPRLDGLEATRLINSSGGPTRVIIVTTFDSVEYLSAAIGFGASGFLLKDAGPDMLKDAVRAAVAGDALISSELTVRLLSRLATAAADRAPAALTARELEVARLVARGARNADIARELFISLGTVKTHLGHIQGKIDARSRVEIARWVWESGLMGARREQNTERPEETT